MNIIRDVAKELLSMFMTDSRLALSVLGLVLFIALLIKVAGVTPWLAGGGLMAGCLIILVSAVCRETRTKKN
jgi:uncharacterized membrane protein YesL